VDICEYEIKKDGLFTSLALPVKTDRAFDIIKINSIDLVI